MIGGISICQLLILLLIVVLVFGTKRLSNIGSDLGGAIKGFRMGMDEDPADSAPEQLTDAQQTTANTQEQQEKAPASSPTNKDV